MKLILFLSLPLYALDQLTKWWVIRSIDPTDAHTVIPDFFHLVYVTNTGAAFGSFKNNNLFFIALSCVALVFVVSLLLRPHPRDSWRDVSLALLLAGILGNVTDRFLHGHVIDFLLFDFGTHVPNSCIPGRPSTSPIPASASRSFASSFTRSNEPRANRPPWKRNRQRCSLRRQIEEQNSQDQIKRQ